MRPAAEEEQQKDEDEDEDSDETRWINIINLVCQYIVPFTLYVHIYRANGCRTGSRYNALLAFTWGTHLKYQLYGANANIDLIA